MFVFNLADPKQNKVSVKIHTVWGIDSMKRNYEGLTFSSEMNKGVSNINKKNSHLMTPPQINHLMIIELPPQ